MRKARIQRRFNLTIAAGELALLLLAALPVHGQSVPARLRGVSGPGASPAGTTGAGAAGLHASAQPAAQPAPVQPTIAQPPVSMLLQPAQEAQIVFAGESLSIHAENSSLTAILHQVAAKSGMRIEGLSGDERVFGNFGPGSPRDVLADLLNGTAFNVVLLGDLTSGGELILTPATRAGAAPAPTPQVNADEASTEPDIPDVPPQQPDIQSSTPAPPPAPATPGVRTPQQLFEQLQRMRQGQQQTQADPQQPAPQ